MIFRNEKQALVFFHIFDGSPFHTAHTITLLTLLTAIINPVSLDFKYGMRDVQYNLKLDEEFLWQEILF